MTVGAVVAPAHLHIPDRAGSLLDPVARLSDAVGTPLDAEQRIAVDALTSVKADGTPAALLGGVVCSRQNLKTFVLERIVLAKLLAPIGPDEKRLIIWSAHLFDTAQESFRTFDELFAGFRFLSSRVKKVSRGNGEEEFELHGRRRLKFKARSKSGGRGLSGDTVVLDEGFALQPGHMGALLPTLSTRRYAHVLVGSSAGMEESEVLRGIRDRGRRGGPGAPAYVEWCSAGSLAEPGCQLKGCLHRAGVDPGCTLDDEDRWRQANPALGRRITIGYLREERRELPPAEWARERLGWWDDPAEGSTKIPEGKWLARADPSSAIVGRRVLALDVTPERTASAIAGAGRREDGARHVGLIDHRAGTGWVADRLIELLDRHDVAFTVLDRASPAAAMLPDLLAAGLTVRSASNPHGHLLVMTAQDMGQACGGLQDGIAGDAPDIWHRGDPILTDALKGAKPRDIGDGGWGWDRKRTDADICPLVAATEAAWGISLVPPDYDLMDSFG